MKLILNFRLFKLNIIMRFSQPMPLNLTELNKSCPLTIKPQTFMKVFIVRHKHFVCYISSLSGSRHVIWSWCWAALFITLSSSLDEDLFFNLCVDISVFLTSWPSCLKWHKHTTAKEWRLLEERIMGNYHCASEMTLAFRMMENSCCCTQSRVSSSVFFFSF